jgi:adenylate cyclase
MRRDRERLRTIVQLVEAETGAHVWADRFNETTDDVFSLQEKVAHAVVAAIEPRLQQHAMNAVAYRPTANLTAYDKYLLGLHRLYAGGKDDLRVALEHMDTSKNPLGARIWGAGCVNDGREHGIWASMVRFAG